jgi:signal transduction histidine kinase
MDDIKLSSLEGHALQSGATPLGRALAGGESVSGEHVKIMRDSGEEGVIAISATPLIGEDGAREGAVAVFRDITEQVGQHEQLIEAYDRLREHDRLKTAFVANISHELRTPLNVIIGMTQLLGRDRELPLAASQVETVGRMERNARALLELVNNLLDYSRLEAGRSALQIERVNVSETVRAVADDFSAEARAKGVTLETEISGELDAVITDRRKISQVVTNLVRNAIKFTNSGAVRVVAAPLDAERWYLEVSDTGIGISREALTFIFDGFRQADDRLARAYGGVGLGLAITRKIVELLEGEINVESEPNAGSRFHVTWPRAIKQRTGTGSLVSGASGAVNRFERRA